MTQSMVGARIFLQTVPFLAENFCYIDGTVVGIGETQFLYCKHAWIHLRLFLLDIGWTK